MSPTVALSRSSWSYQHAFHEEKEVERQKQLDEVNGIKKQDEQDRKHEAGNDAYLLVWQEDNVRRGTVSVADGGLVKKLLVPLPLARPVPHHYLFWVEGLGVKV